jgi:hypothetical protein
MIAIIEPGSAYPATLQLITKMSIDTYHWVRGQQQSSKPRKKAKEERKQSKQEDKKERKKLWKMHQELHTERQKRHGEQSRGENRETSTENIVCIPVRPCKMACLGPLPVTVTHKSTHVSLAEKSRCGCCFC